MIRIKPSISKPSKTVAKKQPKSINEENIRPVAFNTRGYFDPTQPSNQEYLKIKQQVFQKYRNKKEEIVMLDVKNINRGAFIQRGLLVPSKNCNIEGNEGKHQNGETSSVNLLKTYLLRKERKEHIDLQKFLEVPKLNCDQLTLRVTPLTARSIPSRQVSSRISTNSVLRIDGDF